MADVTFTRDEVTSTLYRWELVRDAVAGQYAVEARGRYLPRPNAQDTSDAANSRYDNYVARALYTNFTGRTRQGLIGTAFGKWPDVVMPAELEFIEADADGSGITLIGMAQQSVGDVLDTGRGGIYASYPPVVPGKDNSKAARDDGSARATVVRVRAEQIINWRTSRIGAKIKLSLVVIAEQDEAEDGYGVKIVNQWREMALDGGRYVVRVWRKDAGGTPQIVEQYAPTDGNAQPWTEIPFTFIGATNNHVQIDSPPLYDMAIVNLAWYRNSADNEESSFLVGQPQVWLAGLDTDWRDHMEAQGQYVGSRAVGMLPTGGSATMLQPGPNTLVRQLMLDKQDQLAMLGARLLVKGEAVKTAEQSRSETQASQSVLSLVCDNVSEAYTKALNWAAKFQFRGSPAESSFAIDTEFGGIAADPMQITAVVAAWQSGALPTADKNSYLRRSGLIDQGKDDDEIAAEVAEDDAARLVPGNMAANDAPVVPPEPVPPVAQA